MQLFQRTAFSERGVRNSRFVPFGLALAASSAGIVFSFQSQQMLLAGLLVLTALVLAFVIQTGNPNLGFGVLVITAASLPLEFRGPSQSVLSFPFCLAACLCACWLVAVLLIDHGTLDSSRAVRAALAFGTVSLLSFLSGLYPWFPGEGAPLGAQLGGLALFLLSVGLFLAVGHQLRSLHQLKWLTWLFLGAGAVSCTDDFFWIGLVNRWTRPESLGSLFWTWLAAMSFSQAALNRTLSTIARLSLICLPAMVLYRGVIFNRDWASGWLPPLIAIGVILFFRLPRLTIGLALVVIPAGLYFATHVWSSLMTHEQYSYLTRLEAWKTLWQLTVRNPFFGLGPANYYHYAPLFSILGYHINFNSHNNYMDLLAQAGFLGFIAFGWFAFEIFRMGVRLTRCLPQGFAQAYVIGAIGGLAGSLAAGMLADWVIPFFYNIGIRGFRSSLLFWVFLGGVLALKRMVSTSVGPISVTAPIAV